MNVGMVAYREHICALLSMELCPNTKNIVPFDGRVRSIEGMTSLVLPHSYV